MVEKLGARIIGLVRRGFGPVPVEHPGRSGVPSFRGRWETWGLFAALVLAIAAAALYEHFVFQYPLPPGGDPGEWTAGSFAWVGLPYPSWYANSGTPPLLLPFLGSLVVIGGGPIQGAQLFIAVQLVLYGLTFYALARSFSFSPITALIAEAFVLLNPNLESLYLSGAYQFLFSWVFFNITIAFAVRFLRSRRPLHLAIFWVAASAAVLTHPFMEFAVPAVVGLAAITLLWLRQLPKEVVLSWTGGLGAALFVGSEAGWYFVLPRLFGLHQNSLAFQGAYFVTIETTINEVLLPPARTFTINNYVAQGLLNPTLTFDVLVGLGLLLILLFVVLRFLRPTWLTLSIVFLGSWILAMLALAVYGWHEKIVTTYAVFGQMLVPAVVLAVVLGAESIAMGLSQYATGTPQPGRAERQRSLRARWRRLWERRAWRQGLEVVMLVSAVALILAYGWVQTVPALQSSETTFTLTPHNASFLWATQKVKDSGIAGSIFTTSKATSWMRSLTARNVYAPFLPAYSFNTPHILILEEASLALAARYSVDDNVVAASIGGNNLPDITGLPTYSASDFGFFFPVLLLDPNSLTLTINGNHSLSVYPPGGHNPTIELPPVGQAFLVAVTVVDGVTVTINSTALTSEPGVRINITATSDGSPVLNALSAQLSTPPGEQGMVNATGGPGGFNATVSQGIYGTTFGNVTPASAIEGFGNNSSLPGFVQLHASDPTPGGKSIQLTVDLVSPYSTNLITGLPPCVVATDLFSAASAAFFMFEPASVPSQFRPVFPPNEAEYLELEYGAVQYATNNDWTILYLPSFPQGPYASVGPS
jgi:hypothetical protein